MPSYELTNINIGREPNPGLTRISNSTRMDGALTKLAGRFMFLYSRQVARSNVNPKVHLGDSGTMSFRIGSTKNDRHVAVVTFDKRYAAIHEARADDSSRIVKQMGSGL